MSLAGGGSGMAATHGRYEKEWNAVVPILGCPRSLPSLPQPLLRRCYRVDLMMVLAQHHPSKATAREAAAAAATEHPSGLG